MRIPFFMKPRHVNREPWTVHRLHGFVMRNSAYVTVAGLAVFLLVISFFV